MAIERPWRTAIFSNESTGDPDKDLRVPTDRYYHIYSVRVEYASESSGSTTLSGSTTVRQIIMQVLDGDSDIVWEVRPGATQAGDSVSSPRMYSFAPGNADLTAFRDTDWLSTPIPPSLILPPTFTLRVFDQAISTAGTSTSSANDMQVHVVVGIAPGQIAGPSTGG